MKKPYYKTSTLKKKKKKTNPPQKKKKNSNPPKKNKKTAFLGFPTAHEAVAHKGPSSPNLPGNVSAPGFGAPDPRFFSSFFWLCFGYQLDLLCCFFVFFISFLGGSPFFWGGRGGATLVGFDHLDFSCTYVFELLEGIQLAMVLKRTPLKTHRFGEPLSFDHCWIPGIFHRPPVAGGPLRGTEDWLHAELGPPRASPISIGFLEVSNLKRKFSYRLIDGFLEGLVVLGVFFSATKQPKNQPLSKPTAYV